MKCRSLSFSCEYLGLLIRAWLRIVQVLKESAQLRLSIEGGTQSARKYKAFECVVAVDDCQPIEDRRCGLRRIQAYWNWVLSMTATPTGEVCQGCHCRLSNLRSDEFAFSSPYFDDPRGIF